MHEVFFHQYVDRLDVVEELGRAASGAAVTGRAAELVSAFNKIAADADDSNVKNAYSDFALALQAVEHLTRWASAVRTAEVDADRFVRAARQAVRDAARKAEGRASRVAAVLDAIAAVTSPDEVEAVAKKLLCVPLPIADVALPHRTRPPLQERPASKPDPQRVVAFLRFRLDGAEVSEGSVVQPNILHDLEVEVRMSRWPSGATRIVLEPAHVEPTGVLSAPSFALAQPPTPTEPFVTQVVGRFRLNVSQAFMARPIELVYVAYVERSSADGPQLTSGEVLVQGQRRLVFEGHDPHANPVTGVADVDAAVREVRNVIRGHGVPDSEIADLLTVVGAAGRIAHQAIADDLYDGVWPESRFHADVRSRFRMDRLVAADLEDHPHATGGITDLSFRRIRIELKADDAGGVTVDTATARFGQQIAQYVAGSDRRCGVLIVLDTEKKTSAPHNVQNDIALRAIQPASGGRATFIAVVIVRGNLATPSDLS